VLPVLQPRVAAAWPWTNSKYPSSFLIDQPLAL
jgi:hypothetical protein